ncbi:MAG: hypothetical protein JJU02_13455 [Cryomorphaceae bacterium]|nr:hypothetical protein [Cryomorphaceae bacterium]
MHTFHIPVMGTGYTITSPIKVGKFGINSVVSLGDDQLMESIRPKLCDEFGIKFQNIDQNDPDKRAKRITAYLNVLQDIIDLQIQEIYAKPIDHVDIKKYFSLLPEGHRAKLIYQGEVESSKSGAPLSSLLKSEIRPGQIDVNIMTKLDKVNYDDNKQQLPQEYNDAHAALRGFAVSKVNGSVVFSAGLNPALYSYIQNFSNFFPNSNGTIEKTVTIKVSDYRSALIQGKFLAKKGVWVSEFRIESGLNCGGHAFATDGQLMGEILHEFRELRDELRKELFSIFSKSIKDLGYAVPKNPPTIKYSAQGGLGTPEEHTFLLNEYNLDSIGWGTPFLFVPEAVEIDQPTLELICKAVENQYYTSKTSPFGIPFNSVKGNTQDDIKHQLILKNRPGSACPKKYLSLNTEFTEKPICTASREYQHKKILQLESMDLPEGKRKAAINEVKERACICVGLSNSAMKNYGVISKKDGTGVTICAGPNGAYFNRIMTLNEIVDHIYNRKTVILSANRPGMFLKEASMYLENFSKQLLNFDKENRREVKHMQSVRNNLIKSLKYYKSQFENHQSQGANAIRDMIVQANAYIASVNALAHNYGVL